MASKIVHCCAILENFILHTQGEVEVDSEEEEEEEEEDDDVPQPQVQGVQSGIERRAKLVRQFQQDRAQRRRN